jgi:signal transduction histidine kinase
MRRRILLLVTGVTLLVVLAFAIPLAVLIRAQTTQGERTETVAEASNIATFVAGVVGGQSFSSRKTTRAIRQYVAALQDPGRQVAVDLPDGTVIGGGPRPVVVPGRADGPESGGSENGGSGLDGTGPGDGPFHGPPTTSLLPAAGGEVAVAGVPTDAGMYGVRVFVSNAELHEGETGWWLLLGGASIALLLLGIGAGEVVTRRITRPLVEAADTADRLSAGDVGARAPVDGPPEVAAVGNALNRLADRIDQLIADERETVADLSHRLRTPLTALRLDVESLRDPREAERVGEHVSALERMLTAVIRAARRPQREGRMPSCDAAAVVRDRVAFWSALTDDQSRAARIDVPPDPLPVRAGADDLAAAVDALLENVVAHTSEGTAFGVRLARESGGAVLQVSDDGPGMSPDAARRGRSDRGSTGLGLDIARRCAESTGGAMTVGRADSGGALVTLQLRAP